MVVNPNRRGAGYVRQSGRAGHAGEFAPGLGREASAAPPPSGVVLDAGGQTETLSADEMAHVAFAVMTSSTCGAACWMAVEDVCRCSCGGRNHGCHRRGESAPRTCKAGKARYELVGVVAHQDKPYKMAAELSVELTGEKQRGTFAMRPSWGEPPAVAVQPAKAQAGWPEVADAFAGWDEMAPDEIPIQVHRRRPHLIWRRIE